MFHSWTTWVLFLIRKFITVKLICEHLKVIMGDFLKHIIRITVRIVIFKYQFLCQM